MIPYLNADSIAIVGSNTSGKPVGQFGFDFEACDLRVRAVTFQTLNADGNGDYFTGLGDTVPNFCRATDDVFTPLGDTGETSIAASLAFLRAGSCPTANIADKGVQRAQSIGTDLQVLQPERPNAAQFDNPGLF